MRGAHVPLVGRPSLEAPVRAGARAGTPGPPFPPENLGLLEGPDRAAWQKPEQIMDALAIADGSKVADIGAGAGWFTIRLARRVGPNGVVYAQDVQRQMLEAIRRRVPRRPAKCPDAARPRQLAEPAERALDAVLVVDAYPEVEVEDRVTFLRTWQPRSSPAAASAS